MKRRARDLTQKQFLAALKRHGMDPDQMARIGYVRVFHDGKRSSFAAPENAGPRRRDQLAYLLREQAKAMKGGNPR